MIRIDNLWLFIGPAPVRLSTVATLVLVLALVLWRFRGKSWLFRLYNGVIAAVFFLFLYEVLFNITAGFPPTGNLPSWLIAVMVLSLGLGVYQAIRYYRLQTLSIILLSAFVVDWVIWIITGFQYNFPFTRPLNILSEAFNVSTKLLLALGYAAGLTVRKAGNLKTVESGQP